MDKSPIVIAGYGRSGTTWLSDILSKLIGGLILFEPFHPAVYKNAHKACYSSELDIIEEAVSHVKNCFNEQPKNLWLLRNHLKEPIQNTSDTFVKYIWNNSAILGFKTIRCNHVLQHFHCSLNAQIIYIHRHPLAVIASILNRKNFWEEFGWNWHLKYFFARTLISRHFEQQEISVLLNIKSKANSREELIILMWGISLILSLRQIAQVSGHVISYENLYLDPYAELKKIMAFLDLEYLQLHPSHIFTPSLTTLNTIHQQKGMQLLSREGLDTLFWKSKIDGPLGTKLLKTLAMVIELDERAKALSYGSGYL